MSQSSILFLIVVVVCCSSLHQLDAAIVVTRDNENHNEKLLPTCQPVSFSFQLITPPLSELLISCLILQRDFHYQLTDCDSAGGRWRVQVPEPQTCVGGAPQAPLRLTQCCQWQYFHLQFSFFNSNSNSNSEI